MSSFLFPAAAVNIQRSVSSFMIVMQDVASEGAAGDVHGVDLSAEDEAEEHLPDYRKKLLSLALRCNRSFSWSLWT